MMMAQIFKMVTVLVATLLVVGCGKAGMTTAGGKSTTPGAANFVAGTNDGTGLRTTRTSRPGTTEKFRVADPEASDRDLTRLDTDEDFDVKTKRRTVHSTDGLACAEKHTETNPDFFPGLPNPPVAKPWLTDYQPNPEGVSYTDARTDDLLALAAARANAIPDHLQKGSQDFSKRIKDVQIFADVRHTGQVKIKVKLEVKGVPVYLDLRGQIQDHGKAIRSDVALVQVPPRGSSAKPLPYSGLMTCADLDRGCRDIVFRLDERRKGKIVHSAFVVHRWGHAHITISEKDRVGFARFRNPGNSAFAELISNTVNNACLALLADVASGKREVSDCQLHEAQLECGGEEYRSPGAKAFGLRTWAVAYGGAGFELSITRAIYDGVNDFEARTVGIMVISGPLVHSDKRPMWGLPLSLYGTPKYIDSIYLYANDGGGNLNFLVKFKGSPNAQMRISVSDILPDTEVRSRIEQSAQQMPDTPAADIAVDESI